VERCRKEWEQPHLQATVQVADMLAIPYSDPYFDWIISVQVIYYTTAATLKEAIQHVRDKLRPGGFFFVTFPPADDITVDNGQEIEPRTYQQAEDGELLPHHDVVSDEIDELMDHFII
jgi:SAM-dependent methyltransferase